MKIYEKGDGVWYDELIGDTEQPLDIYNIKVGAAVQRGDLVSGADFDSEFTAATAGDSGKAYAVIAAACEGGVAQGYVNGTFNREKVNSTEVANKLELELLRQGIKLTALKAGAE